MKFEWNAEKARANRRKHRVSFNEAVTVFADWLSTTIPDPDHSEGEERFVLLGSRIGGEFWLSGIRSVERRFESSERDAQMLANENDMKKTAKQPEEMRPHYDFSGGVRGKYAAEYAKGTNFVAIAPDLVKIFPDSEAVNEALRTLMRIAGKRPQTTRTSKPRP